MAGHRPIEGCFQLVPATKMGAIRSAVSIVSVLGLLAVGLVQVSQAAPASASIVLGKSEGPPTAVTRIEGQGFAPTETVDLTFDGSRLSRAETDPTGAFRTRIKVPADALPGD